MGSPWKKGRVPVGPVRDQFVASPVTITDVCRALGWVRDYTTTSRNGRTYRRTGVDCSRLRRTLGLAPTSDGGYNQTIDAHIAAVIGEMVAKTGAVPCRVCREDEAGPDGLCGFCRKEMEQAA